MRPTERETGAVWRLLSAWAEREQATDHLGRRITQRGMASAFGVSIQTLSTWKLCQARMPMNSQLRVIKATGISLSDLTAALAEDEPRIAEWVAKRREADSNEGGGEGDAGSAPANQPPAPGPADQPGEPRLLAVASGGGVDEDLAAEADRVAAEAKAEQLRNIEEMKRKKRGKGKE